MRTVYVFMMIKKQTTKKTESEWVSEWERQRERQKRNKQAKNKKQTSEKRMNEATSVFVCDHQRNIYMEMDEETDSLFLCKKDAQCTKFYLFWEKTNTWGCGVWFAHYCMMFVRRPTTYHCVVVLFFWWVERDYYYDVVVVVSWRRMDTHIYIYTDDMMHACMVAVCNNVH